MATEWRWYPSEGEDDCSECNVPIPVGKKVWVRWEDDTASDPFESLCGNCKALQVIIDRQDEAEDRVPPKPFRRPLDMEAAAAKAYTCHTLRGAEELDRIIRRELERNPDVDGDLARSALATLHDRFPDVGEQTVEPDGSERVLRRRDRRTPRSLVVVGVLAAMWFAWLKPVFDTPGPCDRYPGTSYLNTSIETVCQTPSGQVVKVLSVQK